MMMQKKKSLVRFGSSIPSSFTYTAVHIDNVTCTLHNYHFFDIVENPGKISADIISHHRRGAASSSSASSSSPGSSPPPHKRFRRMQVGNNSNTSGSNAGGSRSVGQRIKEASLKEFQLNHALYNNDENCKDGMCHNNNNTSTSTNQSNGNRLTTSGRRVMRTAALCSEYAASAKPRRTPAESVVLSEKQRNTIRVIGQYLRDLGMNDTVDALVEESGCRIENALAIRLQEFVLAGQWCKALAVLERFQTAMSDRQYLTIRVLLLEEHFKQLVFSSDFLAALHLLQVDYPKESIFKERCEHLATTLMTFPILTSEACENNGFFAFDGTAATANSLFNSVISSVATENGGVAVATANGTTGQPAGRHTASSSTNNQIVLKILQKILPPAFLLPPKRLDVLLDQAWKHQLRSCDLHIASSSDECMDSRAVLRNHQCHNNDFPTRTTQVLQEHHAEVWCLEFSPCGQYLASGAKSNAILIWEVDATTYKLELMRRFTVPSEISGIASLAWSPDSRLIAAAASEENASAAFIFNVKTGAPVYEHQPSTINSFSAVSFFKDPSIYRLACGDQRGHFHVFDVDQHQLNLKYFEGFRIRCLYSMRNGKTVLAADTHNRIRSYNFEAMQETTLIQETSQVFYFTVDKEEKYCLISTKTEGLRLWSLKTRTLIRSFYGSVHHEFVISTSFGGVDGNFIASGSEDENVVIWNLSGSEPVQYLTGHEASVNAVSWNPVLHGMLVSGSDDYTIRVWGAPTQTPPAVGAERSHRV